MDATIQSRVHTHRPTQRLHTDTLSYPVATLQVRSYPLAGFDSSTHTHTHQHIHTQDARDRPATGQQSMNAVRLIRCSVKTKARSDNRDTHTRTHDLRNTAHEWWLSVNPRQLNRQTISNLPEPTRALHQMTDHSVDNTLDRTRNLRIQ